MNNIFWQEVNLGIKILKNIFVGKLKFGRIRMAKFSPLQDRIFQKMKTHLATPF